MLLWGSTLALGLLAASLLKSNEDESIQIVDVEAGRRFKIALPSDCFDVDGRVKLAIQVLKPAGKAARLGGRTLRDSIELSRRRARSAPPGSTRRGRGGRAILDVTIDWSSDQVNRPLGRPLRRASPRRAARQRPHFRGRQYRRGMRRRYRDRWEESTLNVYPSSEVINHHYDTDEELSENDVWHPRNQLRRGLGRRQGHRQGYHGGRRRYYDSDEDSIDYRRRPRRQHHRTNAGRRPLHRRNESTTTGSDTETEEPREIRRRRENRRVTGPVRQRFLNDFDEEISGELVARISLPDSIFPSATPAPTRTNTRMRLRTTTTSPSTTEATIITPTLIETPVGMTQVPTEILSTVETIATEIPVETTIATEAVSLPTIDEAEIVTFQ